MVSSAAAQSGEGRGGAAVVDLHPLPRSGPAPTHVGVGGHGPVDMPRADEAHGVPRRGERVGRLEHARAGRQVPRRDHADPRHHRLHEYESRCASSAPEIPASMRRRERSRGGSLEAAKPWREVKATSKPSSSTSFTVRAFAYPNGQPGDDYTPETVKLVEELGFDFASFTVSGV